MTEPQEPRPQAPRPQIESRKIPEESTVAMAARLRDALATRHQRIVLAESCTAGRIAAKLSELPGISDWLCGSFVVYRADSKARWLGIPQPWLDDPAIGSVSRQVTQQLAAAALKRTPEADVALAVTGDVGPGAPPATDGIVFVAVIRRVKAVPHERQIRLLAPTPRDNHDVMGRVRRLEEATARVLAYATEVLESGGGETPPTV